MPRAKVAIAKRVMNDPRQTNTDGHAFKVVYNLMMAILDIKAADISRDNTNELDDEGLTVVIDKLADIQKTLIEERAILRVKARESKAPEEGSAASDDDEPDSIDKFKRIVQKHFPSAVFDGDNHYVHGVGFESGRLLDQFLSDFAGNILRYNITERKKGEWNFSASFN